MKDFKHLKLAALAALLFCLSGSTAFGQTRKPAAKPATKPAAQKAPAMAKPAAQKSATEITDAEWTKIQEAFNRENWDLAALLAQGALGRLKTDNDRRQLAQLRYFYLYALAGKAASGKILYAELEKTANSFVGKEFLMPSREFLSQCTAKVNYICPVSDNEQAVRVTATNRAGSAIHLFEYVKFNERVAFAEIDGKVAFLGGTLQAAEINLYKQNLRILRLVFEKGFANLVVDKP